MTLFSSHALSSQVLGNPHFRQAAIGAALGLAFIALASPAHAAGSGMPWEGPLTQILSSVEGPIAKIVGTMAIIMAGLGLAFGDTGGGFRKLIPLCRNDREPLRRLQGLQAATTFSQLVTPPLARGTTWSNVRSPLVPQYWQLNSSRKKRLKRVKATCVCGLT